MNTNFPIERLQLWYAAQTNGTWEHDYGISIDTLDNPGWSVTVSLTGTALESRCFISHERHTTEHDWVVLNVEDGQFIGCGGPQNLTEILESFLQWASHTR